MKTEMTGSRVLILDGGMGRELERMGAPFRQPEWSALALIESPDHVLRAHLNFIAAGARVITTNSFAIVPFHIGWERFREEGSALAALAGKLAREAASRAAADNPVLVAGSLPPLFGSYRPDLFDPARAPEILAPLIEGLSPSIDLWLAETQSSIAEALAARAGTADDPRPFWVSFTLEDEADDAASRPRLRSGEPVADAARSAAEMGATALLFNCSQPEIMGGALGEAGAQLARLGARIRLGAYANAFAPQPKDARANEDLSGIRPDLDPSAYCRFAEAWVAAGAGIIGGCCGIGPHHIAAIRERLSAAAG